MNFPIDRFVSAPRPDNVLLFSLIVATRRPMSDTKQGVTYLDRVELMQAVIRDPH